jgi:polysaccharide export outer membrane protein
MARARLNGVASRAWLLPGLCALCLGCQSASAPAMTDLPGELRKVTLPDYTIAPPDVLAINALRIVPKPPYHIEAQDILNILVSPTFPEQPISGLFVVDPDGTVNLGFNYGSVSVIDKTLPEAKKVIQEHLKSILKPPEKGAINVNVTLAQSRGLQLIRGDHLVRPDGTIGLGVYGSVRVAGLTIDQARKVLTQHLSQYLVKPELSVDVSGFNSKVYYIITDSGGYGQTVYRLPITGSETVLDAIAQINGTGIFTCLNTIWVARPSPADAACVQVLPVDWKAITQSGATGTNYQLFPGDRIFLQSDPLVRLDTGLQRIITPMERLFGITLLGNATVNSLKNLPGTSGTSGSTSGTTSGF